MPPSLHQPPTQAPSPSPHPPPHPARGEFSRPGDLGTPGPSHRSPTPMAPWVTHPRGPSAIPQVTHPGTPQPSHGSPTPAPHGSPIGHPPHAPSS